MNPQHERDETMMALREQRRRSFAGSAPNVGQASPLSGPSRPTRERRDALRAPSEDRRDACPTSPDTV